MKQLKAYLILVGSLLLLLTSVNAENDIGMLGLKDFSLGNNVLPQDRNIQETQKICVYSIPSGKYQIEFMSTDNKMFYIENDKVKVPVKIYWNNVELQPNSPSTFNTGEKTVPTSNCQNVTLTYKVQNTNFTKTAGNYKENVRFKLVKLA
jgi:hypothetical protein